MKLSHTMQSELVNALMLGGEGFAPVVTTTALVNRGMVSPRDRDPNEFDLTPEGWDTAIELADPSQIDQLMTKVAEIARLLTIRNPSGWQIHLSQGPFTHTQVFHSARDITVWDALAAVPEPEPHPFAEGGFTATVVQKIQEPPGPAMTFKKVCGEWEYNGLYAYLIPYHREE